METEDLKMDSQVYKQLEKQTSGLVGSLHYLLDRDTIGTKIGF